MILPRALLLSAVLFAVGGYCSTYFDMTFGAAARWYAYQYLRGSDLIDKFADDCEQWNGSKWTKKVPCVMDAIEYVVGSGIAIAATGSNARLAAESIANQAQTLWARDDVNGHSNFTHAPGAMAPPVWNWTAIEQNKEAFYDYLGGQLPGDVVDTADNHTLDMGLINHAAILKHHHGHFYYHASNLTHGVVGKYHMPGGMSNATTTSTPGNATLSKRTKYTWHFGAMSGIKYSYDNTCGNVKSRSSTKWRTALREMSTSFTKWAYYSHPANKYVVDVFDPEQGGSPFVMGYLIFEKSGFGKGYEGHPKGGMCVA